MKTIKVRRVLNFFMKHLDKFGVLPHSYGKSFSINYNFQDNEDWVRMILKHSVVSPIAKCVPKTT